MFAFLIVTLIAMKKILLISFVFSQLAAYAQQDAWVYFNQKENVQASIDNPISILTQQSIDRKLRKLVSLFLRNQSGLIPFMLEEVRKISMH
jgi:hypothetical protein